MGAWGTGVFDNDGAGQLLAEIRHAGPERRVSLLRQALEFAAGCEGYLENPEAQEAVAAAALVAAARQGSGTGKVADPEVLGFLAGFSPDPDLLRLADHALARVVGDRSEWRELWEEASAIDEPLAAVLEVRAGLR